MDVVVTVHSPSSSDESPKSDGVLVVVVVAETSWEVLRQLPVTLEPGSVVEVLMAEVVVVVVDRPATTFGGSGGNHPPIVIVRRSPKKRRRAGGGSGS